MDERVKSRWIQLRKHLLHTGCTPRKQKPRKIRASRTFYILAPITGAILSDRPRNSFDTAALGAAPIFDRDDGVDEAMNEMHSVAEVEAFSYGFRLGVRLMIEAKGKSARKARYRIYFIKTAPAFESEGSYSLPVSVSIPVV